MDKAAIKAFVQNTLRCGCPEEVFQHIACEAVKDLSGTGILHKINIGNRLLVYVLPVGSSDSLKELLPRYVSIGRTERDSSGFNRFRLVLTADDTEPIQEIAEDIFMRINRDDKVHLHILPKNTIPTF